MTHFGSRCCVDSSCTVKASTSSKSAWGPKAGAKSASKFSCSGKGRSCGGGFVFPLQNERALMKLMKITLLALQLPSREVLEIDPARDVFLTPWETTLVYSVPGGCQDFLFTCHVRTDFKNSVVGSSCPTWQSGNSHFKCGMGSCPIHGTMNIYACHPICELKTYYLFVLTMHFCKQFGGFRKFCNRVATENDFFLERDIPGIIWRVHAKAAFQCGVKWTVTTKTPGRWAIQFILERHQSWYMKWGSLYIPTGRIEWQKRLNIFQVVLYFWNSPTPFDIASSMVGFPFQTLFLTGGAALLHGCAVLAGGCECCEQTYKNR